MNVYFIKTLAGPRMVKIGKAQSVLTRLDELQIGCPFPLQLVGAIRCKSNAHATEMERQAHRIFGWAHYRGEWFNYHKDMEAAVQAVLQAPPEEMFVTQRIARRTHRKTELRIQQQLSSERRRAREEEASAVRLHDQLDSEFRAVMGAA